MVRCIMQSALLPPIRDVIWVPAASGATQGESVGGAKIFIGKLQSCVSLCGTYSFLFEVYLVQMLLVSPKNYL